LLKFSTTFIIFEVYQILAAEHFFVIGMFSKELSQKAVRASAFKNRNNLD
jgi:hypothetical protein